jgi:hypothetical protein
MYHDFQAKVVLFELKAVFIAYLMPQTGEDEPQILTDFRV